MHQPWKAMHQPQQPVMQSGTDAMAVSFGPTPICHGCAPMDTDSFFDLGSSVFISGLVLSPHLGQLVLGLLLEKVDQLAVTLHQVTLRLHLMQ